MIILGLNAFHGDSSAALVRDGKLVAAAEEERFRRVKHWAGFPSKAIAYCLREAGLRLGDVQHVAVNQDSRANLLRKIALSRHQSPRAGAGARPIEKPSLAGEGPRAIDEGISGPALRGHVPQHRTSSRASFLRLSRVSLRAGGRRLDRRLRRFLERGLGRGKRHAISPSSGACTSPIRSASSTRR